MSNDKSDGPICEILTEQWNDVHAFEYHVVRGSHIYDWAASYMSDHPQRAQGRVAAQRVSEKARAVFAAFKDLDAKLQGLLEEEQAFVESHGHPKKYIKKTQKEFGFV